MEGVPTSGPVWSEHVAPDGRLYYFNRVTQESSWDRPAELGPPPAPMLPPEYAAPYGGPAGYGYPQQMPVTQPFAGAPGGVVYHPPFIGPGPAIQKTRNSQGPPGCNLFIFHIPNDMTNQDLFTLFSAYGNVISARIMVDRDTGRSRGFGFVSFDTPESSTQAIAAMDGKQFGRKRLKVALKKEKTVSESRWGPGMGEEEGGGGGGGGGGGSFPFDGAPAEGDPAA